jgi:pyruvate dehydrogenase E1 component alpha subunit
MPDGPLGCGGRARMGTFARFASRSMPPLGVMRDDGSLDPTHAPALSEELTIALYEHMALARALDEKLLALQSAGSLAQHSSAVGEEATIVGAAAAMSDQDWVFPSSRDVAAALWRGMPLAAYAHHAFGTARDPAKGRGSPGPPFWKMARVASASPLAGARIPHAVGVAWAARLRSTDLAALVFFDEGATGSGDFHTGLNFAGVTRAPVVAICRNSGWRAGAPASRQTASAALAIKAVAYGLHGMTVDGGDILAVLSVVREARRRAAAGLGATLVEAVIPDGGGRPPDPPSDPIARLRRHLESRGLWDADRQRHLLTEVHADVDRAVTEAMAAGPPGRHTLFEEVYAEPPWHLVEQRDA